MNQVCKKSLDRKINGKLVIGTKQHEMRAREDFEGRTFQSCEKCGAMFVNYSKN